MLMEDPLYVWRVLFVCPCKVAREVVGGGGGGGWGDRGPTVIIVEAIQCKVD
jgi:hypothetical protein